MDAAQSERGSKGPPTSMICWTTSPIQGWPRELPAHIRPRWYTSRAASCWALDAAEARAEKVRAAFTREAIRDFYDLERLAEEGTDFSSREFVALADQKLAEVKERPLREQLPSFGLDEKRRRSLEAGLRRELPGVLRSRAPPFDLVKTLARFDRLWVKLRAPKKK